jgi:hypothetical protein
MMRPTRPGRLVRVRTSPATAVYDIDVRLRTVPKGGTTNVVVGEAQGRRVVVTAPEDLTAAFTRFGNREGVTSLPYTSQLGE